jgi:hypothetical protein
VKSRLDEPELLRSFDIKRPSLVTWRTMFLDCSKALALAKEGGLSRHPKDPLDSAAVRGVLDYVGMFSGTNRQWKKQSTTTLLEAISEYRNLTRGHGCIIHRGFEDFVDNLEDSLISLMTAWEELLNLRLIVEGSRVDLEIDGQLVDARLFLRLNNSGRVTFYSRAEHSSGSRKWLFLDYDTGLHESVPEHGPTIAEEVRLQSSNCQLSLFPRSKKDVQTKYGAQAVRRIKKFLSFTYGDVERIHPGQEREIALLTGMWTVSKSPDVFSYLLKGYVEASSDNHAGSGELYWSFVERGWLSLAKLESAVIEGYCEDLEIGDVACMLSEKLDQFDDDGDRDQLDDLRNAVADIHKKLVDLTQE